MPVRAPSICVCGKVVSSGTTCPCRKAAKAARDAKHDQNRPNSSQRGYGGGWERKARQWRRGKACAWPGCTQASEMVDHIIPHKGDAALRDDPKNWQALCHHHHNSAKQRADRRRAAQGNPT